MPFKVTKCDFKGTDNYKTDLAFYQYDAEERANYDFKFGTDSGWGSYQLQSGQQQYGFQK